MLLAIKQLTITLLLIIGVMMFISIVVLAQSQSMSVEKQIKILKDKLELNNEQIKKITEILEDQREEMTTAKNDNRGNNEALRTVMLELKKKTDEQIRSVLTDDQLIMYDKWQKEQRAHMGRRMKARSIE